MAETLFLRGTLQGHSDMVTAIAVQIKGQARIVSSSRDKSLLVWNLNSLALSANGLVGEGESAPTVLRKPFHRLTGHAHYVQDVVLSSDSMFALSCSRDGMLRLWDLSIGVIERLFVGHLKCVLSVALLTVKRLRKLKETK
ncbi:guanine nucleotide-binding protein subunit beta-like protein [Carex littledalei]|uniref:Guanine nucleotide-binding protein subunit beta-like protein n=1 Tax=Carex littledalei TaxID=544730 RepID=A0A833W1B8_9POAL|nr:guanine nucleotide-binding protein subunit beta-like protein [Carex littledalei]